MVQMPPGLFTGEVIQACPTGRKLQGGTTSLSWFGNASGFPLEELEEVAGRGKFGDLFLYVLENVLAFLQEAFSNGV